MPCTKSELMSTLNTTNVKNPSSGSNNIALGTDGSVAIQAGTATPSEG